MNQQTDTVQPEAMTKTQLAARYKVCTRTLNKWIKPFMSEIGELEKTYIFTPEQVRKIYEKLGEP
jgi:hypothetical protein